MLIHKALFLFHFTEGKQHVALHCNLTDLFERAANIISDTRIDEFVLKQLMVPETDLIGIGFANGGEGASWINLAVRLESGVADGERDELLEVCQSFHTKVSLRMRTHLSLMAKNIDRTTWLAARLYHKPSVRNVLRTGVCGACVLGLHQKCLCVLVLNVYTHVVSAWPMPTVRPNEPDPGQSVMPLT